MLIRHIRYRNILPILVGTIALIFGAFIYLLDRPASTVYFIRILFKNLSLYSGRPSFFGSIGYNLPGFIHVFAFSLITAGVSQNVCSYKSLKCLMWFIIDAIFELGQKYPGIASRMIPNWFDRVPFLENTKNYFKYGTYDIQDMVSYALGACAAYIFLTILEKGVLHEDRKRHADIDDSEAVHRSCDNSGSYGNCGDRP